MSALALVPVGRMDGGRALAAAFADTTSGFGTGVGRAAFGASQQQQQQQQQQEGRTSGNAGSSNKSSNGNGNSVGGGNPYQLAFPWPRLLSAAAWVAIAFADSARPSRR